MVVNKKLFGLSENQLITIKSFNHRNDINVIEFEEDNEDNMGIHIAHTDVSINELPIVDDNNCINIIIPNETWNRNQVIELLKKYSREACGQPWFDTDDIWVNKNL